MQIGKDGLGENLIKQVNDALEARELIKGRVLDNNLDYDARREAEELAERFLKTGEWEEGRTGGEISGDR